MFPKRFRFDCHVSEGTIYSGVAAGVRVNVGTSIVGGGEVSVTVDVGVAVAVFEGVSVGVLVGV